jgi:UDP-glucose 4-epimerase
MRALGWTPTYTIRDGVLRTVDFLTRNEWVLEERA